MAGSFAVDSDVTLLLETGLVYTLGNLVQVDLTVNGTLLLQPGVTIEFPGFYDDLIVNDTLLAQGTDQDSIRFIGTNATSTTHGGKVRLTGTSTGSVIEYAEFDQMGDVNTGSVASLWISTSDATIGNVRITDSETSGLYIDNGSSPSLGVMEIQGGNKGIEIADGSPAISGSVITGATTHGILITNG